MGYLEPNLPDTGVKFPFAKNHADRKAMHRLKLALIFLAALVPTTHAQKRPMTFEDMIAMKRLGETTVSPEGKWLAYSVTTVDLANNTETAELWIQQISGGDPHRLEVAQPGDSGPQFSSDGKRILFVSSRTGSQQIWLADFYPATGAAGNPIQLTHNSVEPDNARWSPDGHFVLLTAPVYPDCPAFTEADASEKSPPDLCNSDRDKAAAASKVKAQLFTHLLYRHWNHFTGDKRSHIFHVLVEGSGMRDLTPNDPHDVPPFSLGGDGGFSISPDSRELAFTENPDPVPAISTSAQIYTLDLTSPSAKPVKISTSPGGNFTPAYSPDGKYIAWRSQQRPGYESDKFRLVIYDRSTKTIKDLLPNFENWVDGFAWAPDSMTIYFTGGTEGESPIFVSTLDGAVRELWNKGEFSDFHPLPEGKYLVADKMTVSMPSEVLRIRIPSAGDEKYEERPITHLNYDHLVQLDLAELEKYWFTVADKTKLQGFVITPPGFDPKKKYPTKLLIHGGPQGAWGDSWSYRWNAELFAATGYVVVMINPRGSTGYGQAVVDGVNGDWGGKPFTDLMAGLDYAEQHYPFIDKSRECALGASYGGYMANWVLGHTNRFKCIVSHDGMFNAESAFGSTEEDWFNTWEFKGNPWDYDGKPDAENPFRRWSPALAAKNFKTPTLVIHSQLDYRLDVSEGFQLFDTLQLLKVPSQMLYFPDEGHWVLKPQNSRLWYKTVNAWVDNWTTPK
jgi:dipeptidyl aminopeptidase/acylaminoacyl peptidase